MEVYEAMRSAPTTRAFAPDPVPAQLLRRVLDNARFAPSGGNRQGWRAEGLGAALTTLLTPAEPEVKRLLSIPDDVALAAYVLVGRRSTPWPERLARRPVESFAFAERYGQALT